MPNPYFRTETEMMKNDAIYAMLQGRTDKIKRLNRAIKRSWHYKDGKKKAVKLGVTVGLTTIFVCVGVATHGAGIPVIAALAAGSFLVGKMNDTAFAKLYGRQYTGGQRTRDFIVHIKNNPVAFDTEEQSKSLSSRAHKTIRRACQHYRTALEKLEEFAIKIKSKPKVTSCDEAAERVTALLQVKRHFDKSRLYIHPAFYLSKALLNVYKDYWDLWVPKKGEEKLGTVIVALMKQHQEYGDACGSEKCYWQSGKDGGKSEHSPAAELLWSQHDFDHRVHELEEAEHHLSLDPTVEVPSIDSKLSADAQELYRQTNAKYLHRSIATKMKHSVTNTWDRKTKSEKVAFGISQVASVGMAAGTAGGGAHIPEGISEAVKALIEYGHEAVSQGSDIAVDAAAEAGANAAARPGSVGGTKAGKEGQECIQKAAIHISELLKVDEKFNGMKDDVDFPEGDVCGTFMAGLYEVYRMKHHVVKTQAYLGEAIEMVAQCAEELHKKIKLLKEFHNEVVVDINQFLSTGNHSTCKNCYKGSSDVIIDL